MKNPSTNPAAVLSGQVCAFFEQNRFRLGLVTGGEDKTCRLATLEGESIVLATARLILLSKTIYPTTEAEIVLTAFHTEMDNHLNEIDLSALRMKLLPQPADVTLADMIKICSLPEIDAFHFALYQKLRECPAWFRSKKGVYHINTDLEAAEYFQAEEQKEQHRRDLEACPILAKKGLPVLFNSAILADAEKILAYDHDPSRADFTSLECWTIDAEDSPDLDDAITLQQTQPGWSLGIHISEVDHFIKKDSSLDREAALRTSSVYLPGQDVHMLPESLSCDKASLLEGKLRPALSVVCVLDSDLDITDFKVVLSTVKVSRRISYIIMEEMLRTDKPAADIDLQQKMLILQKITDRHIQKRKAAGAREIAENVLSPARKTVAECMVIYNSILAELASKNDISLYYRTLAEESPEVAQDNNHIPPSMFSTLPKTHTALGLKAYAQFSSPLRRYADLVNQRQIADYLKKAELPYTRANLEANLEHLAQTRQRIRQVTQQAESLIGKQ